YAIHYSDWGPNQEEIRKARARLAGRFPAHPYLRDVESRRTINPFRFSIWLGVLLLLTVAGSVLLVARKRPPVGLQELSVQEKKILAYLYEGRSNKEIAGELHIEPSTVKS